MTNLCSLIPQILILIPPITTISVFIATITAKPPTSLALLIILAISSVSLIITLILHQLLYKQLYYGMPPPTPTSTTSETSTEIGIGAEIEAEADNGIESQQGIMTTPPTHTHTHEKLFVILERLMRSMSNLNGMLLHSASITYIIILAVRINAVDTFGGEPSNLDFGTKGSNGDDNLAFTPSWKSYGHFIQGFVAVLLSYPAITGTLARIVVGNHARTNTNTGTTMNNHNNNTTNSSSTNNNNNNTRSHMSSVLLNMPSIPVLLFCQLLSASMTIYPLYSLIKRNNADKYGAFSRTSHLNNTAEWLLGYILGIGIGPLVTVLVQRRILTLAGLKDGNVSSGDYGDGDGDADADESGNYMYHTMSRLKIDGSGSESGPDNHREEKYGFGFSWEYNRYMRMNSTRNPSSFISMLGVSKFIRYLSNALLIMFSLSSLVTGVLIARSWNYKEQEKKDMVSVIHVAAYTITFVMVLQITSFLGRRKLV